ncbi:hypothetical protein RAS2_18700 [Phycisphaerae bacterium RAS2]|nr:hypothetical protein RAS2_18700 [Phycisphaerae bacterium RAS2]
MAQLEKVDGVEKAFANRSGRLIRATVSSAADREEVAGRLLKVLAVGTRKPVRLTGKEVKRALDKEEWRAAERVGELSAIEFRTLALRRVAEFVQEERIEKAKAEKLTEVAEEEWDRLVNRTASEDPKDPGKTDWSGRFRQFADVVAKRTESILTVGQIERLKRSLSALPQAPTDRRKE